MSNGFDPQMDIDLCMQKCWFGTNIAIKETYSLLKTYIYSLFLQSSLYKTI